MGRAACITSDAQTHKTVLWNYQLKPPKLEFLFFFFSLAVKIVIFSRESITNSEEQERKDPVGQSSRS